ncbi:hypothetical protein AC249_AIPGENE5675, partial [Exaiptasia diaphana]
MFRCMRIAAVGACGLVLLNCYPKYSGEQNANKAGIVVLVEGEAEKEIAVVEAKSPQDCALGIGSVKKIAVFKNKKDFILRPPRKLSCNALKALTKAEIEIALDLQPSQSFDGRIPAVRKMPDGGFSWYDGSTLVWVGTSENEIQVVTGFYGNREGSEVIHGYSVVGENPNRALKSSERVSKTV